MQAGLAVRNRLVRDRELAEVVAKHLGLDLDGSERLAVVHTNNRANHLGNDDHIAQVRLDNLRLGTVNASDGLLGDAQLLKQVQRLALKTTHSEATARTRREQLDELLVGELKQVLEVDAAVRKFLKGLARRTSGRDEL